MASTEKITERIVGYLTRSEREALETAAANDDRAISAYVRVAIREKIAREATANETEA